MRDLRGAAASYLEAEGYDVSSRDQSLLVGSRGGVGVGRETVCVWVREPDTPEELRRDERALLTSFGEVENVDPSSRKFLVLPSYEGLTTDFRRTARRWFNVKVTVPALFFDTPFSSETSSTAHTAAKDLQIRGDSVRRRRIPQPYTSDDGTGDDLLRVLRQELPLYGRDTPAVHVVAGPGGIGKSFLFESLYAQLYEDFQERKRRQELWPRPLPLLPEHLTPSDAPRIRPLLRTFLETEFVRPLRVDVFRWMLTHGTALWMLDGLDEIINQDLNFVDLLLDILTDPSQTVPPSILICVRDSLVSTNPDFYDLCTAYPDLVRIYNMENWGEDSKQVFAEVQFPKDPTPFVERLSSRESLTSLSSVPYYCALLGDLYAEGELREDYTESQLLDHALSAILQREYDKDLLDPAVRESDIRDFLQALAVEDLERANTGIPVDEARELGAATLPESLPEADIARVTEHLTQLALLSSRGPATIGFAQEILEQYVLGLALFAAFRTDPAILRRRLSHRVIASELITLRLLASKIQEERKHGELIELLLEAQGRETAYRNLLQVAIYSQPSQDALLAYEVPLEYQNLAGVSFEGVDLKGASFRGSDLTNAEFIACDLQKAIFEGSILKNTLVAGERGFLQGAAFGDFVSFFSIRRHRSDPPIDDFRTAQKWFEQETGVGPRGEEPCPAATQLRHLFGKFVYPTGEARRSRLDRRGVVSGKRALDPEMVLGAALRLGYLQEGSRGERILRPEGDHYSELRRFTTNLRLSPGLRTLLDDVCGKAGCAHVPQRQRSRS